jgi:hypothetical protein
MGAPARSLALLVACVGFALAAPAAGAAPTRVELRIEGKSQTLFEGPISTQGHPIEASSDTQPRRCDGVNPNVPENTVPGATATAAAVDAMALIGETFDGQWYPGIEDYLITRWGTQRSAEGESWYLFINNTLSNLGGCQFELREGDEVLWAFDASPRKVLALYPSGGSPGAPPLTATAKLGAPLALQVAYHAVKEGRPPVAPESSGFAPYAGAVVAPVSTSPQGAETLESANPAAVVTDAEGGARVTFTEPGWHRLKAGASGSGLVRSNRLDVCVPAPGAADCGAAPGEGAASGGGLNQPAGGYLHSRAATPGGPEQLGPRTLRIGGLLLVPLDARSAALHYRGRWRLVIDARAWHGVVALGGAGATLSVRLGRGRPAFVVRDARHKARVQISAAGRSKTFAVAPGGASHLLLAPRRGRGGLVRLRVLAGTVGIDGVAVAP